MRRTKPSPYLLSAVAGTCALLAACSNPFASDESDYGRRVALERLREVETIQMDKFKKAPEPAPAPGASTAEKTAEEAKRKFEALGKAELTLEECRASALTHNLDLKVALIAPTIAQQSVSEEEGRFDAAFTLRGLWQETDSPTSSTLASAQAKYGLLEPGVRVPLRTGETINVTLPMDRTETDNQFATLNPAYTSDLKFSMSQPLLRGAGRRANTAAIRVASYLSQAESAQTKLEAIRQLAAVDRAYWQLFQARRNLEVTQQQFDLAQAQLRLAEHRVTAGNAPEIEVLRAQSGVADRLGFIITAQNQVLQQQRELKRIINMPGLTIDSTALVVPSTLPDPVEYTFDSKTLGDAAVANRMEMLDLELRLAADAATIDFNRNQALPLLTMDYTYNVNGLGASGQDSFHTLEKNHFEDWSVGLSAEVPIGNQSALAKVRRAILVRVQRLATRDSREQSIRQEVLNAIDSIEAGWQRVLAARQATILSARTLAAEQRQFEVGASTSTNVLDQASRLAEAQLAEIRALTDYQVAQVDLAFATGTLLGAGKVRFDPEPEPDPDIQFRRDALRVGEGAEDEQIKEMDPARKPHPPVPGTEGASEPVETPPAAGPG